MSPFQELGEGVFRRRYPSLDLNVGVVLGEEGVLLVDTRASEVEAEELAAELGRLTRLPVRWVVDTHWHWDHVFGNAVFPAAEIWGHQACHRVLAETPEEMRQEAIASLPERREELEAVRVTPPNRVVTDSVTLDLGGRSVQVSFPGLGHTDSDLVVWIPGSGVLFAGDLLEEGADPCFGDGYPLVWPSTVRTMLELEAETVVPGHGDVMGRPALLTQLEELEAVAEAARLVVAGKAGVEEAARLGPYPAGKMVPILERARRVAG